MTGKHLSHYLIESELGRGGMGIVYRALDTKLDRTVAIKVLPSAALASEDDRARFYREAKAAAALTHPHIAIIHAVDEAVPEDAPHGTEPSPFIAMEFIDGETLEDRIAKGPLKLEEAVRISSEVAGALKLAHENEIVHRDIKSANVMLTGDDAAKVLDFGLAQTAASTKLTRAGSTVGTIAYMSPEQARGEEVDRRTDVWSLGVVLYEMVAGRSAFPGEYEQAVVYELLNQDPEPLTAVRTGVPMALEWIVGKCLAKNADDRYQRMEDLLIDLRTIDLTDSSTMSRVTSSVSRPAIPSISGNKSVEPNPWYRNKMTLLALSAAFIVGAIAAVTLYPRSVQDQPEPLKRFAADVAGVWVSYMPSVSDDGTLISFLGTDESYETGMWIHELSTGETRRIGVSLKEVFISPFSPDGRQVLHSTPEGVFREDLERSIPVQVTDSLVYFGLAWLTNDIILHGSFAGWWIHEISSGSQSSYFGSAFMDKIVNEPEGIGVYFNIEPIPEHRAALASVAYLDSSGIDIAFLHNGTASIIVENASWPKYSKDGFFTYAGNTKDYSGEGPLLSQLIDPETGLKFGAAVPVVPDQGLPFWRYDTGKDGSVWISEMAKDLDFANSIIAADPRSGEREELVSEFQGEAPDISPDGNLVVWQSWSLTENRWDVYYYDIKTKASIPIQRGATEPKWDVDNQTIYFKRGDTDDLFRYSINITESPQRILTNTEGSFDVSKSGSTFVFGRRVEGDIRLFVYDAESGVEEPLGGSAVVSENPAFSPGETHVVAQREQDGEYHIVVYELSAGNPAIVSNELGENPIWSPDGGWIYYRSGERIRRIAVSLDSDFRVSGNPQTVFEDPLLYPGPFSIAADGRLVLLILDAVKKPNEKARVILNWGDELRRLAGVD